MMRPTPAARRPSATVDWTRLATATLARTALYTLMGLLVWSAVPALWGWTSTTVMSDSMAPHIRAGDVVVAMPVAEEHLIPGRVLLVDDPDHTDRLRLHRLVDITASGGLVTKGDANTDPDSSTVALDEVRGVAVIRSPFAGLPVMWIRTGQWMPLAAAAALLALLVALTRLDTYLRRERDDAPSRSFATTAAVALAAISCVSLVATSLDTHAAFAGTTATPASSLGSAPAYDCYAAKAAVLADAPAFVWNYGEASGTTVLDRTTNARTGLTAAGATRTTGTCVSSPAVTLNGSTTGLVSSTTAAIAAPTTFSVETWFRTTSALGGRIVGWGANQSTLSGRYDRHIWMGTNGRISAGVYASGIRVATSTAAYNDGAWHHAVLAVSAPTMLPGQVTLSVDGAVVGTASTLLFSAEAGTGYWRVGYDNLAGWGATAPTNYGFVGDVDGTAVFSTALPAARVAAHFAAGR